MALGLPPSPPYKGDPDAPKMKPREPEPEPPDTLSDREQRFALEYLKCLDATKAYRRAFGLGNEKEPSTSSERNTASEIFHRPHVAEFIAKKQRQIAKRLEISAERVIQEYAKVAFANLIDYVTVEADGKAYIDLSDVTREQAAALAEYTIDEKVVRDKEETKKSINRVRIKFHSKIEALDSLSKHLGLFKDGQKDIDLLKSQGLLIRVLDTAKEEQLKKEQVN